MSKDSIALPQKPVDFTIFSENGLGQLKRFPREIRNMIYSSIVPTLMVHGAEDPTVNLCVLSALVNAPILATSKQLCVEFLEIFMQEVHLEENDEYCCHLENHGEITDEYYSEENWCEEKVEDFPREKRPECLERLLAFIKARINYMFHTKKLGLRINTIYFHVGMVKHMADCMDAAFKSLPGKVQRLWDIHKDFGVPSENIYINFDYWEPGWWVKLGRPYGTQREAFPNLPETFWDHDFDSVSAIVTLSDESGSVQAMHDLKMKTEHQLLAYMASKLREFQVMCASEEDQRLMSKVLKQMIAGFYDESPFPQMLEFHKAMGKMANNFWKAKEEQ